MVTDAEYRRAGRRGRAMRKRVPHATSAAYVSCINRILITLSDGLELALNPTEREELRNATAEQISVIELWGAGWSLHFPLLDEDIYIPHLLRGLVESQRWMARREALDRKQEALTMPDLSQRDAA